MGSGNRLNDTNTVSSVTTTTTKIQGYPSSSNRIANQGVNGITSRSFLYDLDNRLVAPLHLVRRCDPYRDGWPAAVVFIG
jgi:hypothetical protein